MIAGASDIMIRFDPKDSATREFLDRIGMPEESIEKGGIDLDAADDLGLNGWALLKIADSEVRADGYLSPAEAKKGLALIEKHGEKALALFSRRACPGCGIVAAQTIISNMLGKNDSMWSFGVSPESRCPYDPAYSVDEQKGIHFLETQVPEKLRVAGAAVVQVWTGESSGSAVVVSPDGGLLTARHVLYGKDGRFKENVRVSISGREYPIAEKDVIESNIELDTARVRIQNASGLSSISIAKAPPLPDELVWAIGFPEQMFKNPGNLKKTFTVGKVRKMTVSAADGKATIVSTAKPSFGNSGGALVNKAGELEGIVGSCLFSGDFNILVGNPDLSTSNMPGGTYRGTPDDIKDALDNFPPRRPSAKR